MPSLLCVCVHVCKCMYVCVCVCGGGGAQPWHLFLRQSLCGGLNKNDPP